MSHDDTRDVLERWRERTGHLRDPFRKAVQSDVFESEAARRNALSIEMVQKRADHLRERLAVHVERHRPRWEAREEQLLRRQHPDQVRLTRGGGPKPPPGANTRVDVRDDLIRTTARRTIERRIEARHERIDRAEDRMIRDLSQDHDRPRSRSRTR